MSDSLRRAAPLAAYIGLMSGTSTDGVDAVLADFHDPACPLMIGSASLPMPAALRAEFLALNHPGADELHRAALAANQLADLYAAATTSLLRQCSLTPAHIRAIGAHGQTVRHDPAQGYTVQINAPARLAELTGIAVVADFRSRDIAAGGQGAPLVPAFHQTVFAAESPRVILNLGGIANITILQPGESPRGFDTGPANVLLDSWIHRQRGADYDEDGAWAASGTVDSTLLNQLLTSEPWLQGAPPKSTGRHHFNLEWLLARLEHRPKNAGPLRDEDIQATLQAFTVRSITDAILRYAPKDICDVLVCGGGAFNASLMGALACALPYPVRTTADHGVPPQLVEALAFAWLAYAWDHEVPAGLPEVTGACGPRVLGCKYPA